MVGVGFDFGPSAQRLKSTGGADSPFDGVWLWDRTGDSHSMWFGVGNDGWFG